MTGAEWAPWAGLGVAMASQVYLVLRNSSRDNHHKTTEQSNIKKDIQTIMNAINDPKNGLSAIKEVLDKHLLNCAHISTAHQGKIDQHEKSIDFLRSRVNGLPAHKEA